MNNFDLDEHLSEPHPYVEGPCMRLTITATKDIPAGTEFHIILDRDGRFMRVENV